MPRKRDTPRRQKPIQGERRSRMSPYVMTAIEKEVHKTAARYHVSPSFVCAVALAEYFGITEQETYLPIASRARMLKLVRLA